MTKCSSLGTVILVILVSSTTSIRGQSDFTLTADDGVGATGELVEVSISLDHPNIGSVGWRFGVCSESSVVIPVSVTPGSAITPPPDFHANSLYPEGWTTAVVVDLGGFTNLAPGLDQEIEVVMYEVVGEGVTDLCFCGNLGIDGAGSAPSGIDICSTDFVAVTPDVNCGSFTGTGDVVFRRGDCNDDGTLDLADSIFVEQYLFLSGATPTCLSSCDANGDGSINIADSIYGLNYLFVGGPPPPAPFPNCGSDPTPTLDCSTPTGCP